MLQHSDEFLEIIPVSLLRICLFPSKEITNKYYHKTGEKKGELPLFKWDLATNQWGLALASVWWALVVPLDNVEGKISRLEAPFWWLSTSDTGDWEACIQALFIGSTWGGGTWEFLGLSQPRHLEIARLLMHKVQLKPVEIWLKHTLNTCISIVLLTKFWTINRFGWICFLRFARSTHGFTGWCF